MTDASNMTDEELGSEILRSAGFGAHSITFAGAATGARARDLLAPERPEPTRDALRAFLKGRGWYVDNDVGVIKDVIDDVHAALRHFTPPAPVRTDVPSVEEIESQFWEAWVNGRYVKNADTPRPYSHSCARVAHAMMQKIAVPERTDVPNTDEIREAMEEAYRRDLSFQQSGKFHLSVAARVAYVMMKKVAAPASIVDDAFECEAPLTFKSLRAANLKRLGKFKNSKGETSHTEPDGSDWSLNDWCTAVCGELGELANLLKKIRRGDTTLEAQRVEVGKELADVMIYLDILAFRCGVDLADATIDKFNEVSDRIGVDVKIAKTPAPAPVVDEDAVAKAAYRAWQEGSGINTQTWEVLAPRQKDGWRSVAKGKGVE